MKLVYFLPVAVSLACAQESAFEEIESKARKSSFQEKLEIREVRESSAKDVGEALTKLDGVSKVRKGGIANDIVVRGFQQDNISVLVDGIHIYGACPNNMDPPAFHVDFAEIKEVDIVKGAFDIRHAGSLGGTVNIINKNPAQGLRITPNLQAGSFGFWNPSLTASYSNDKVYVAGGQSFRRSEPYRDGRGVRFTERANYRANALGANAFDVNTWWAKAGFAPGANQRLEFAFTRQQGDRVLYPYLQMDALYDNADRASANYYVNPVSSPLKQFRVQSYFTGVKHWMTDELRLSAATAPRPYSMGSFASTKAAGARVEAETQHWTAGFEGFRRNWDMVNAMRMGAMYKDQHAIPAVAITLAGFYTQYNRLLFDRLQLSAGARFDASSSKARATNANTELWWAYNNTRSLQATDTQPSANVQASYRLGRGWDVFSGVGHSARLPDPRERYFALQRSGSDWVGNPGLRPVENTEADVGFTFRNRRFYLRPTAFYSNLDGYIVVHNQARVNMVAGVMNAAARSYANVPAEIYGGELSYQLGITGRLLLFGGLSYTRGSKDAVPALGIFSRDLSEMPPLKSRSGLRYGSRLFFAEAETILANASRRVDTDLREQPTPGYGVVNIKGGIHARKLSLNAGIDNLLDRFYYESCSYQRDPFRTGAKVPEPGRSVFVAMSYGF